MLNGSGWVREVVPCGSSFRYYVMVGDFLAVIGADTDYDFMISFLESDELRDVIRNDIHFLEYSLMMYRYRTVVMSSVASLCWNEVLDSFKEKEPIDFESLFKEEEAPLENDKILEMLEVPDSSFKQGEVLPALAEVDLVYEKDLVTVKETVTYDEDTGLSFYSVMKPKNYKEVRDFAYCNTKMSLFLFSEFFLANYTEQKTEKIFLSIVNSFLQNISYNNNLDAFFVSGYQKCHFPAVFRIDRVFEDWVTYLWIYYLSFRVKEEDVDWLRLSMYCLELQIYYGDHCDFVWLGKIDKKHIKNFCFSGVQIQELGEKTWKARWKRVSSDGYYFQFMKPYNNVSKVMMDGYAKQNFFHHNLMGYSTKKWFEKRPGYKKDWNELVACLGILAFDRKSRFIGCVQHEDIKDICEN